MGATLTLIDLAGAISLLLWGVHMVQTGIQRAYGAGLRRVLGVALDGRVKAFAAGLAATAALQSSTATGLMVSSFAAAGLVDLVQALAAMLGANVGTTLIDPSIAGVGCMTTDALQVSCSRGVRLPIRQSKRPPCHQTPGVDGQRRRARLDLV